MDSKQIFTQRFWIALFNLLLAASVGTVLRYVFIHSIAIVDDFRSVLHAHSHVAMMGWGFMALFGCLLYSFSPETSGKKIYHVLFWMCEVFILILLVNFWVNGYDVTSIVLLTVYIAATFVFSIHLFRDVRRQRSVNDKLSIHLLWVSLFFLCLSAIGILGMAPTMIFMKGSLKVVFYYLTVQFYMHFQYSGWFIFACLALFFRMKKNETVIRENKNSIWIVYLFAFTTAVTFCFDIFWALPDYPVFLNLSVAAAIIQLIATVTLLVINKSLVKAIWGGLRYGVKILFMISFISLLIKEVIQVIIIYPGMAQTVFILRSYVIAYLHLIFLGITTVFLLGYAWQNGVLIIQSVFARFAVVLIISCIFLIELALGIMGSLSWAGKSNPSYMYILIFAFSLSIVMGIAILFLLRRKNKIHQ